MQATLSNVDKSAEKDCVSKHEQNGESHKPQTSFEDAIIFTEHGKFHVLLLVVSGCCLVAMVGEVFGIAFLIPAAQCEFEMTSSQKGLLNAISYIGMITSSHLWGYLADTRGRRKMLIVALLLDGICAVLSSFAYAYWLFLLLRFFNGFFICAPSAVAFAYLGEFHSGPTRSRAILFMSVFLSLGGFLQQGSAWLVIPQEWALELAWPPIIYSSWRIFILINSLPSFVAAAMLFCLLPESPKFLLSVGREQQALDVLKRVYSINTGRKGTEYPVTSVVMDMEEMKASASEKPTTVLEVLKSMWLQTKPLFQRPNVLITTLAFIMQFSFYASFNGLAMWLPDMYNKLALYTAEYPDHALTLCEVLNAMKSSTDSLVQSAQSINETAVNLITNSSEMVNSSVLNSETLTNLKALAINTIVNNTQNVTGYSSNDWPITLSGEVVRIPVIGDKNVTICVSFVDASVFRNNLYIGCVCMTVYLSVGYIVSFVKKKPLIMGFMVTACAAGIGLNFAFTEFLVVAFSAIFIASCGICANMVNSIVVDCIPTQLRAMAVCLSLMSGRFGVAVSSLMIGALLDLECTAVFYLLSTILLGCCFLAFLLPAPPKNTT